MKDITSTQAPVAAIDRLRMQSDGQGIATLVAFQGCPLRCKMCPNAFAISDTNEKAVFMTPGALYEKVKLDELYFLATGGGVTFGGGEPLLHPVFIRQFREICGNGWHLCAETSLSVPWNNIETVADVIDVFYIDCKDTNPAIYKKYTGKENAQMLENLKKLAKRICPEKIIMRIPLIPGFNTEANREKSVAFFSELGLNQFDLFTYITQLNP